VVRNCCASHPFFPSPDVKCFNRIMVKSHPPSPPIFPRLPVWLGRLFGLARPTDFSGPESFIGELTFLRAPPAHLLPRSHPSERPPALSASESEHTSLRCVLLLQPTIFSISLQGYQCLFPRGSLTLVTPEDDVPLCFRRISPTMQDSLLRPRSPPVSRMFPGGHKVPLPFGACIHSTVLFNSLIAGISPLPW